MNTQRFQNHVAEVLDMIREELQEFENVEIEYSTFVKVLYSPQELQQAEDYLMSGFLHGIITGDKDFCDYYCLDNRILRAGFDREKMRFHIGIDEEATARWQGRMDFLTA